jgi:predicted small integral membrane protein
MTAAISVWLFQSVHAVGLSVWCGMAAINNLQAFRGSQGAVGATMSMAPLREAPSIATPLLARAIASSTVHRMALLLVLALQILATTAGIIGSHALITAGGMDAALPWLNLALSSAAAFLFTMHLGGLWFAYWMRQETLQLTHLVLLIWTLATFALFNQRWV